MFYTKYNSPLGQLLLVSDGENLTGLWMENQPRPEINMIRKDDFPLFTTVQEWLDRYFRGDAPAINELPLSPAGTEFQLRVWDILRRIPYGETVTYGDIARKMAEIMGKENMSAQAVGGAVGRNPISIIIPCHRVVGSNRKLTGYAGGLDKKIWLLHHERWLKEETE